MHSCIFPVHTVEHHDEKTQVDKPRRGGGRPAGSGAYEFPGRLNIEGGTGPAVEWLNAGLALLNEVSGKEWIGALDARAIGDAKVHLMRDNGPLAEAEFDGAVWHLRIDTSAAEAARTAEPRLSDGLTVLAAMIHCQLFCAASGHERRDSYHAVFDLFRALPAAMRRALLEALRRKELDANGIFRLSLESVNDPSLAFEIDQADIRPFDEVTSRGLRDIGDRLELARIKMEGGLLPVPQPLADVASAAALFPAEAKSLMDHFGGATTLTPAAAGGLAAIVERVLKWRDKWVTWLTGQLNVDIPYNQQRVFELLKQPFEDVDEKRAVINEAISKSFRRELEDGNIERIGGWASENGMRLVSGRLSRAFGNQAHLLSVAKYLSEKQRLVPLAQEIHDAVAEDPELQTPAARLLHFVRQQKKTSAAMTVGALNHLERALIQYESNAFKRMLRETDDASRRPIGKPPREITQSRLDVLQKRVRGLFALTSKFREELEALPKSQAAYVILMQRLHPAETINLAHANSMREVHTGKEEDLRDLARLGGHYTYSSPGNGASRHWINKVNDWVEAIPLFIHERVIRKTVVSGGKEQEIETIETEVDQEAMEAFFRLHAEFWAQNLDEVMDSEHITLARRWIVERDSALRDAAEAWLRSHPEEARDEGARQALLPREEAREGVAALAALIAAGYRERAVAIHEAVETGQLPRIEALARVLSGPGGQDLAVGRALASEGPLTEAAAKIVQALGGAAAEEAKRLAPAAFNPSRPVSSLHILTTESAGMTEGYVQTWIEEEMALYNVIRAKGLEGEVKKRMDQYRARIVETGRKVIEEFGMPVVIDEVMAEQRIPADAALMTVLMSFKPVARETAKLAVLIEHEEANGRPYDPSNAADPDSIDRLIAVHRKELEDIAVPRVAENNGKAFESLLEAHRAENPGASLDQARRAVIQSEEDYRQELESIIRWEARERRIRELNRENPGLCLPERVDTYLRNHTSLAKSFARRETLAAHKLQSLTMDPLYHYQAAGGNKRYNLLYTPSRVNLGHRERDSVAVWRQWVGGADQAAAQAGFEVYSLVNEGGVEERPALSYAEVQKTSENALCVTHFAGSNALALLIMAVLEGDQEDMADQMNLREDRLVPPAGEGYGGYCVPKDGLFLAFVLSLRNEVKLRQIGVPEHLHKGIMEMAKRALLKRADFESDFEWQRWAAEKLLQYDTMNQFIGLRDGMLVFQVTKIARAVENLGRPWHETADGAKLLSNLAAEWGVHKMIICAEQVVRFMVFYKAWSIYDALREAKENHAACPAEDEAVVAVSAEYKPVQDVRFSTGLRLFEIFAGTGDHLTRIFDEEGQNLTQIMMNGFDPRSADPAAQRAARHVMGLFGVTEADTETLERLKRDFPPHRPPADIVVTSVTLSSTQDMLHYTSDAKLDEIADTVQTHLSDYGLTEDQIRANCQVYGGRLRLWAGIRELPGAEKDRLVGRLGGSIHALVLRMRGPGRDYERDVQGVDVLNTGIVFKELLALLDDPPKLIALMRNGNPNSALAVADGAAGRDRRAMTYYDIMLFFAACERIGRRGVYRAIGLGKRNVERLRAEMQSKKARAQELLDRVRAVADADTDEAREAAIREAASLYRSIRSAITNEDEAGKAIREEDKLKRYNKWKPRDSYVRTALSKIGAGLPLGKLDFGAWIAGVGGAFAVCGLPMREIEGIRRRWERALEIIGKDASMVEGPDGFSAEEIEAVAKNLVRPAYEPEMARFAQQMLVESSSKAVEIAAKEALERRKALRLRAERAKALSDRETGFQDVYSAGRERSLEAWFAEAHTHFDAIREGVEAFLSGSGGSVHALRERVNGAFGRSIGCTRAFLETLARGYMPQDTDEERSLMNGILADIGAVYTGREIILEEWKKLAGGYEDIGGIARIAEAANHDAAKLGTIAKGIELFYNTFALSLTLEYALSNEEDTDRDLLWKNITDFFAETINDHWYEYWPWGYARGAGFQRMENGVKFEMATERHAWVYRYLRTVMTRRTELAELSEADLDSLLGNYLDGKRVVGIGANAPTEIQKGWRAYNQLREIAFMRTDGFAMPPVFDEFDPDIIEADRRVNMAILFPVGRTHVSRALREGPSLNKQLQAEGRRGANLIITRYNDFAETPGAAKKTVLVTDGHFYISGEEYREALKRHKGMDGAGADREIEARRASGALTPKGIRVAARFVQNGEPAPVVAGSVIPFHGLPIYVSGQLEDEGLPATIQSRIYTDITYDKSLYPRIYNEESGVNLPPEIDWINEWNDGLGDEEIIGRIIEGWSEKAFPGLRTFGAEHPIVLIKGAAESGARNLKVFELQDMHTRLQEEALRDAARFILDVSRNQNVVIQTAILTSPEFWASNALMENFVERQILEWNTPVNRDFYPRSQIYGSLRIVASAVRPEDEYDTAFPICLTSLQVATNVGRGGTLEPLLPEFIQEKHRRTILDGLRAQAPKVMKATEAFAREYQAEWEAKRGMKAGGDLRGVSYLWPQYLMLDYLITPEFKRPGRLIDIAATYGADGRRTGSVPILQDEEGRFEGDITGWKFILLEPNVGIGLWDRFNLREEVHESRRCRAAGEPFDWDRVGASDRIVLRNYLLAGEQYLEANFGGKPIERAAVNRAHAKNGG